MGVDIDRIIRVARRTAESEGATGEISITLVIPDRMAELNEQYMGKAGPTDVLAFPIDGPGDPGVGAGGPPRLIGEVVLCPELAAGQATSGVDAELDLLVAHGVLHLLGYDHATESGAEQMRLREHDLTGQSGAKA
jgi:probable rRNA maturation factor